MMDRLKRLAGHFMPFYKSKVKVAVLGAAGGIGQPLSLLLKLNPLIDELSLYDIVNTPGVGVDLSHINTNAKVKAYLGDAQLGEALSGCDLVIIPAGVPRKPGMTRDDLFNINAKIVKTLVTGVAEHCPKAFVAIISNPVNSTVPITAEVLKQKGCYDPLRLFGVTTLDVVRAETFIAEILGVNPKDVSVPVIGGHAGITILPLLSQVTPKLVLDDAKTKALMERIQNAGTEVVEAKAGTGSATLSMAYAAAEFANSCLKALNGDANVVQCSFVASNLTELPFFASPVRIGKNGIEEFLPIGDMSGIEQENFEALKTELTKSIQKGVDFVAGSS